MSLTAQRNAMVAKQIEARGVTDPRILRAFREVPREAFVPEQLREFSYRDTPLPIGHEQTISQPYIVALMIDALNLGEGARVLDIGTGSGYAAAILSRLAAQVFTVERIEPLARQAEERFSQLGYSNIRVLCGDGTLGWPENARYDAIVVAAGGPEAPQTLLSQLAIGGRLIMPIGPNDASQILTQFSRVGEQRFDQESLGPVRFVPLIGQEGWPDEASVFQTPPAQGRIRSVSLLLREVAEQFDNMESANIEPLLERASGSRIVLLGESTHGTSEFYRMRTRITRELVRHYGFDFVAVEADWPDAARVDRYVLSEPALTAVEFTPFSRFPQWMWRNQEVRELVEFLRSHNAEQRDPKDRIGFHGLDLYSMMTSIAVVLSYLDRVDPRAAVVARERYGSLTPWQKDPAAYGRAVLVGRYASSEEAVVAMLKEMLERRLDYSVRDGERFFDAAQNARVVSNAEKYYRAMYYGSAASWNLRDSHMFDTLQSLLDFYGPSSRGIVWEHNSHVGNAAATEMSARGEFNVGQLARATFGDEVYIVGFGTDHGTVAAASDWGAPMQRMQVRPSLPESYERIFHESEVPAFSLALRNPRRASVREELVSPRLERAIGVVYRPETELQSHYFQATLPYQFDEFIWFDETQAVQPLPIERDIGRAASDRATGPGERELFPFGL